MVEAVALQIKIVVIVVVQVVVDHMVALIPQRGVVTLLQNLLPQLLNKDLMVDQVGNNKVFKLVAAVEAVKLVIPM
jgi:hypothetical protein